MIYSLGLRLEVTKLRVQLSSGLQQGCGVGPGPSSQFGEAQRQFGGRAAQDGLSTAALTNSHPPPQQLTMDLGALLTAQHEPCSSRTFGGPAHVQSVFFTVVLRDLVPLRTHTQAQSEKGGCTSKTLQLRCQRLNTSNRRSLSRYTTKPVLLP